jgi:hypothetical protein
MLHVHDHRSRREPVEQAAVATVAPEPLPPIVVHDADLWDTAPMPHVAPTIDFLSTSNGRRTGTSGPAQS